MSEFVDIHSHIIPNVDDGSNDIEESREMLKLAYSKGIRTIIATPHYKVGDYTVEKQVLVSKLEMLKEIAKEIGQDFEIYLGNEILGISGITKKLKENKVATMADSRYALVEFMPNESYANIRNVMQELQCNGYLPILAHVERYEQLRKNFEYASNLSEMGVYFQVNASSISKFKGIRLKKFINKLIDNDMVHFVATDAHDMKNRRIDMSSCAKYIEKKYGNSYMEELLIHNPRKIIKNEYI